MSLKMVFPRSARLSIVNDNQEGSLNKPMVHNNEIVADMNVEKKMSIAQLTSNHMFHYWEGGPRSLYNK